MLNWPMSSPQMIRMFGFLAAVCADAAAPRRTRVRAVVATIRAWARPPSIRFMCALLMLSRFREATTGPQARSMRSTVVTAKERRIGSWCSADCPLGQRRRPRGRGVSVWARCCPRAAMQPPDAPVRAATRRPSCPSPTARQVFTVRSLTPSSIGDLLGQQALHHLRQHAALALGQAWRSAGGAALQVALGLRVAHRRQRRAHRREQRFGRHRLGQKVAGAGLERAHAAGDVAAPAEEHGRQAVAARAAAVLQRQTVGAGHVQVEQQAAGGLLVGADQELAHRRIAAGRVAGCRQHAGQRRRASSRRRRRCERSPVLAYSSRLRQHRQRLGRRCFRRVEAPRQSYAKDGAAAVACLDRDLAVVRFDDCPHDRQSESQAMRLGGVEGIEHAAAPRRIDATAADRPPSARCHRHG